MAERLVCPRQPVEVVVDQARFVEDVAHDRCPLSGCGLEPFERAQGLGGDGQPLLVTTGRCAPTAGGCGAEWAPFGADEVAWYGREVELRVDWPEDDEEPDD